MVSSPSSCPPRSGSAAPPTPSRRPRSGATQPARSGEQGPASEPSRPLAFLLRNSTLLNSLVPFLHQALSTRSRSCSAPFLHQAPAPLNSRPSFQNMLETSRRKGFPAKSATLAPLRYSSSSLAGLNPPRRRHSFGGGGGTGAACFPSSKARPLATVCQGRTRWLLRRRGLVVVVMVAWLAFVVMVAWLALWLRWLLCG